MNTVNYQINQVKYRIWGALFPRKMRNLRSLPRNKKLHLGDLGSKNQRKIMDKLNNLYLKDIRQQHGKRLKEYVNRSCKL